MRRRTRLLRDYYKGSKQQRIYRSDPNVCEAVVATVEVTVLVVVAVQVPRTGKDKIPGCKASEPFNHKPTLNLKPLNT